MIIYKITNLVNGKVYIGQTTKTLEQRILQHRNSFVSNVSTHLYHAMHKYGWDNFVFEVIDCSAETKLELNRLEQHYIKQYNSMIDGYNMTAGGESNPMQCKRSREKHDLIMQSNEVKSKISNSMKSSYAERGGPTAEHRKHLSEQKKELYASEKGDLVRAKFRASYTFTPEHKAAAAEGRRKSVYCVDTSGQMVARFDKVKYAAQWWQDRDNYFWKDCTSYCDYIKKSFVEDVYIRGLKWIYEDEQAGHRA